MEDIGTRNIQKALFKGIGIQNPNLFIVIKCVKLVEVTLKHRFHTCTWSSLDRQIISWWRHQMETFSALLVLCTGNSPVPGEFPAQRPVTFSLIYAWIND